MIVEVVEEIFARNVDIKIMKKKHKLCLYRWRLVDRELEEVWIILNAFI